MTEQVKIAFERKVRILPIADLLPTKALPAHIRETAKYRRIEASISELGLVEPLSIARHGASFLLLDGHMRRDVLQRQGVVEAPCVIADDDCPSSEHLAQLAA